MIALLQDLLQYIVRILIVEQLLEVLDVTQLSMFILLANAEYLVEESYPLAHLDVHVESILNEARALGVYGALDSLISDDI